MRDGNNGERKTGEKNYKNDERQEENEGIRKGGKEGIRKKGRPEETKLNETIKMKERGNDISEERRKLR